MLKFLVPCFLLIGLTQLTYGDDLNVSEKNEKASDVIGNAIYSGHIYGELIRLPKNHKKNVYGSQFYLKVQKNGEDFLFPVEIDIRKFKDLFKFIKKKVLLKVDVYRDFVKIGERNEEIFVLKANDIKYISLKELGAIFPPQINNTEESGVYVSLGTLEQKQRPERPTIGGIPDTVANTTIFAAGAALIAKIILGR